MKAAADTVAPGVGTMTARDVLKGKGRGKAQAERVLTIRPEQPLIDAIQILTEHSIGALLVVSGEDGIVGIITERDILRAQARLFDHLGGAEVQDLMTRNVIIALASDSVDYLMNLFTKERIRHVPIMEEGQLVGILSIGDVVKARARQAEGDIRYLTDYIKGRYPG
jgi:CBS domain-containing protein